MISSYILRRCRIMRWGSHDAIFGAGSVLIIYYSSQSVRMEDSAYCEDPSSTNLFQKHTEEKKAPEFRPDCCPRPSFMNTRKFLHWMGFSRTGLSIPRLLTAHDPVFNYAELVQGLSRRSKDEVKLRQLSYLAKEARDSGDPSKVVDVMHQISEIAYGKNITPQMRENFSVRYGCTGWTEEILMYILNLSRSRGIVEIGAGHGQWARILSDRYENELNKSPLDASSRKRSWDNFILAFDNMDDLPLSPQIYHSLTQPAKDFFFPRVKKCVSHVHAIRRFECRGRVLLLVYPPPGDMALETVQAYVDAYPQGNDTVVYVGEGKGGANASDAFFDYFLKEDTKSSNGKTSWCILKIMDVLPPVGGKGYEKVFVLKRIRKE